MLSYTKNKKNKTSGQTDEPWICVLCLNYALLKDNFDWVVLLWFNSVAVNEFTWPVVYWFDSEIPFVVASQRAFLC